jgi:dolichol-phosphate mannosyltransferase
MKGRCSVMKGTVLLATYNEGASIEAVLSEVEEAVRILARSDIQLSVLVVDDNSPDGTSSLARKMASTLGLDLAVLSGTKEGLGVAIVRGLTHITSDPTIDFVISMDADGQHDARQIPDLVRAHLSRKSHVTIGSRWVRGGSSPGITRQRKALSLCGNFMARRVCRISHVYDATTSFRVIDRRVVELFSTEGLKVDGYGFFSAFIALAQASGFVVDEVPIVFRPRYSGVSKLTLNDNLTFFANLFLVRKRVDQIRSQRSSKTLDQRKSVA